jgi:hypothetical protein
MRYTPAGGSGMEAATLVSAFNDFSLWQSVMQVCSASQFDCPSAEWHHHPRTYSLVLTSLQALRPCLVGGNRANLLFALDQIS